MQIGALTAFLAWVIAPPQVLAGMPTSFVSAFRIEPGGEALLSELSERYLRLAGVLDDICDHVDDSAEKITLYGVREVRPQARRLL